MRLARLAGWGLCGALLMPWGQDARRAEPRSLAERLVGPVASLAASAQWVRFDRAVQDGREEEAYAIAERALALDPRSPEGWLSLAHHLMFRRASVLDEPDPARRARFLRAGLDVLRRGEERCEAPAELAQVRGQTLVLYVAEFAGAQLDWPGGRRAALEEGLDAAEAALRGGHPAAPGLVRRARRLLAEDEASR